MIEFYLEDGTSATYLGTVDETVYAVIYKVLEDYCKGLGGYLTESEAYENTENDGQPDWIQEWEDFGESYE